MMGLKTIIQHYHYISSRVTCRLGFHHSSARQMSPVGACRCHFYRSLVQAGD